MKQFRANQSGFTLLELLIVLAILGVLAAVVVVSVVGLMGKGQGESYAGDVKTIQTAASAFYADMHTYSGTVNGWNETGDYASVHNYPTANGSYSKLHGGNSTKLGDYDVNIIMNGNSEATTLDIQAAAIWMGVLTNGPGSGTGIAPVADTKDNSAPLKGENGPYLNPLPDSCSTNNSSFGKGTYTWIVGDLGRVYGVFPNDYDNDGNVEWFSGFGGRYP